VTYMMGGEPPVTACYLFILVASEGDLWLSCFFILFDVNSFFFFLVVFFFFFFFFVTQRRPRREVSGLLLSLQA